MRTPQRGIAGRDGYGKNVPRWVQPGAPRHPWADGTTAARGRFWAKSTIRTGSAISSIAMYRRSLSNSAAYRMSWTPSGIVTQYGATSGWVTVGGLHRSIRLWMIRICSPRFPARCRIERLVHRIPITGTMPRSSWAWMRHTSCPSVPVREPTWPHVLISTDRADSAVQTRLPPGASAEVEVRIPDGSAMPTSTPASRRRRSSRVLRRKWCQ
jgi:hypothetical protein